MQENILNQFDLSSLIRGLSEKIDKLQDEVKSLKDLFNQTAGSKNDNPNPKDEMGMDELIVYLPTHPGKSTIHRWMREKGLPSRRMGRRLYFNRKEVDEWFINQSDTSKMETLNRMVYNSMKAKQNKMKSFKVIPA